MTLFYPNIHTEIALDSDLVVINGIVQKVRPKTFQLLKILIEANGELVSKITLLESVWDDVIVDEQVVFQSIKELRKLFPGQTVIKTVPRKGYAWLPRPGPKPSSSIVIDQPNHDSSVFQKASRSKFLPFSLTFLLLLVIVLLTTFTNNSRKAEELSGSVVVLPVQSDILSNDHDWVRYGLMDQVISRLASSQQAGVLQTDYVLDVISRSRLSNEALSKGEVDAIFDVSGAELILFMRLTGKPKDYQLVYTLHLRDHVEKGVILDDNAQSAADKVATIVGKKIAPDFKVSHAIHQSSFINKLVAEGIETKYAGNSADAIKLLEAANISEPSNLAAARLLVQMLVETGASYDEVSKIAMPAITLVKKNNSTVDQIRLSFWFAISKSMHNSGATVLDDLVLVERLAKSINDWLYLAYIDEIRGQYYLALNDFTSAKRHFLSAMDYHAILHCPLGKSNTLMLLSKLAKAEGQPQLAIKHADTAFEIVKTRNLSNKFDITWRWLEELKN